MSGVKLMQQPTTVVRLNVDTRNQRRFYNEITYFNAADEFKLQLPPSKECTVSGDGAHARTHVI